ncbi:MAG: peptidylprolyl isomerase [Pelagibacteraceae bacterium]|nr:peptidylprolyl isomerase [Pelagibacteraceae bacterium]MCI5079155.1 peptidylprolyl isomerase [Pelagibacteraceae bacterium]
MQSLTKKIAITIITGIIIIVFGAWGMGDLFSDGNKNIIAEIKDKKIYTKDYIESARNYVNQKNKTELADIDHSLILNNLLAEKIYEKFAEDMGIVINDDALAYYIQNIEEFKDEDGKFSRTKYEKYLLLNNLNVIKLEEYLRKELIKNLVVQLFTNGISSTNYHLKKIENEFLKQVKVEFYQIENGEKITDEKIEKYFNQNKQKFSLGELREGEVAKLDYKTLGFEKENDQFYKLLNSIENDVINNLNYIDLKKKYNIKTILIEKINRNGINKNRLLSEQKQFTEILFSLNENFKTEIIEIKNVKYLVHLKNIIKDYEVKLETGIKKEIQNILNYKKNKILAKNITESNDDDIFEISAKKYNLKIENVFFENILDNNKIFAQKSIEQIFSAEENKVLSINEKNKIYILKIKKISKNKNKIDNLDKILKNQTKQEFKTLILRDLDAYLIKKYPINLNERVLNQVKNSF